MFCVLTIGLNAMKLGTFAFISLSGWTVKLFCLHHNQVFVYDHTSCKTNDIKITLSCAFRSVLISEVACPYYAHIRVQTWQSTRKCLHVLTLEKHIIFSFHPLSGRSALILVSLRPLSWKVQSPLTNQLMKAWAGTAHCVFGSSVSHLALPKYSLS